MGAAGPVSGLGGRGSQSGWWSPSRWPGPKWLIVGRRLARNPFKRVCASEEKESLLPVSEGRGMASRSDRAPGGCLVPGAPITDFLVGVKEEVQL